MTTPSGHTSAIGATKVLGTTVKDLSGHRIGQVEDIVLDKQSNSIMYAVVGFGGFLGLAEKFHPLPWASLDYQPENDAYVVPFTKDQLMKAPADSLDALTAGDGVGYRNQSYKYYNVPADW